jgi:hypothetical protein
MLFLFGKLFFISLCSAEPESVYSLDRIMVVIDEKVITKSDVQFEEVLREKLPSDSKIIQYYREQDPVEALIQLHLLKSFAGEIALYKPDLNELQKRFEIFLMQWTVNEYKEFLSRYGADEQQIKNILRNMMVAENYVERNLGLPNDTYIKSIEELQSIPTNDRLPSAEDLHVFEGQRVYEQWIQEARNNVQIRFVLPTPSQ